MYFFTGYYVKFAMAVTHGFEHSHGAVQAKNGLLRGGAACFAYRAGCPSLIKNVSRTSLYGPFRYWGAHNPQEIQNGWYRLKSEFNNKLEFLTWQPGQKDWTRWLRHSTTSSWLPYNGWGDWGYSSSRKQVWHEQIDADMPSSKQGVARVKAKVS